MGINLIYGNSLQFDNITIDIARFYLDHIYMNYIHMKG